MVKATDYNLGPPDPSVSATQLNIEGSGARIEVNEAFDRADNLISSAQGAISTIASTPSSPIPSAPDFSLDTSIGPGPSLSYNLPAMPNLTPPTPPADFQAGSIDVDIPDISAITVPLPPDINLPASPTPTMPTAPAKPSLDTTFTDPGAPTIRLGAAPTLDPVLLPDEPNVSLPSAPTLVDVSVPDFSASEIEPLNMEDVDVTEPALPHAWGFNASDVDPQNVVLEMGLKDSLKQVILDMSTPHTVEDTTRQEVARQEDLIDQRARRQIDEAFAEYAARGHTAPPGALSRRTDSIRADADAEVRSASRDVAMERMRQEVQVFTTKLQTGVQLAAEEINASVQQYQLALSTLVESHRATVEAYNAIVGLYRARVEAAGIKATLLQANAQAVNTQIQAYNARIDGERLRVQANEVNATLFQAQIRGALAPLEVYQAQMEGARTKVQANLGEVQVYEARLRGEAEKINLYQSQLQAERTKLDGALAQVQAYQGEIDAFRSEVGAVTAQYDNYKTQVDASIAPIQLFEARMRGYASQVDAERTKVDAGATRANAQANVEQARSQAYQAKVRGFGEEVRAYAAELEGEYRSVQAKLNLADTQVRGNISAYDAQISARQAQWQAEIQRYTSDIEAFRVRGNLLQEKERITQEAVQGAARISSSLAAAALSSVNVGEQISTSSSRNLSHSTGYTYSESASNAYSGSNQYIFQNSTAQ